MTNERKINLTSKPLCDFRAGDTLYIQKLERDHNYGYLCEFIELKRGIVVARIVEPVRFSKLAAGCTITARPTSCYLWGHTEGEMICDKPHFRCHWFKNTKEPAK